MTKAITVPEKMPDFFKWLDKSDFYARQVALGYFPGKSIEYYIMTGATLLKAQKEEDWKKAQCDNFKEWVEGICKISHTQSVRMIGIARTITPLIPKHHDLIVKIPFMNLYELTRIIHLINDEDKLIEMFHSAANTTERGFKDNTREIIGKLPATDTCDHMNIIKKITTVEVCRRCGKALSKKEESVE